MSANSLFCKQEIPYLMSSTENGLLLLNTLQSLAIPTRKWSHCSWGKPNTAHKEKQAGCGGQTLRWLPYCSHFLVFNCLLSPLECRWSLQLASDWRNMQRLWDSTPMVRLCSIRLCLNRLQLESCLWAWWSERLCWRSSRGRELQEVPRNSSGSQVMWVTVSQ